MKYKPFINPELDEHFISTLQDKVTKVKKLILESALKGIPKRDTEIAIARITKSFKEELRDDIPNKQEHVVSFQHSAYRWNAFTYTSVLTLSFLMRNALNELGYATSNTPNDILKKAKSALKDFKLKPTLVSEESVPSMNKEEIIANGQENIYMGEVIENAIKFEENPYKEDAINISRYQEELQRRVSILAEDDATSMTSNIDLRRKVEIDLRLEHQKKMVDDLINKGQDLCYLSSHVNCSKRCAPWQGKLVSLTKPSVNASFETGEVIDNQKVYSLKDITSQVDKYGYFNNIIIGFNCRHFLIPYTKGSLPPKQYNDEDIVKERKINDKLRAMERDIVKTKERALLYENIDIGMARKLHKDAKRMVAFYKAYAHKNNFPYFPYRIKIYK